jgi:hypothetical protein
MKLRSRAMFAVFAVALLALGGIATATTLDLGRSGRDASQGDAHRAVSPKTDAPGVTVQTEFVAVAPCRVADTRHAAAGKLSPGVTRSQYVAGTFGFAPQGGKSGGCGIPLGASAVVASVSSTQAAGAGYLHAWALGASEPNATVLNWTALGDAGITTGATIPLGTGGKIAVKGFAHPTHLIIDITGYYREPIAGEVSGAGTLGRHSNHVLSSTRTGKGGYSITFDQDVSGCILEVTTAGGYDSAGGHTSGTSAVVFIQSVEATGTVFADSNFAITVTC